VLMDSGSGSRVSKARQAAQSKAQDG